MCECVIQYIFFPNVSQVVKYAIINSKLIYKVIWFKLITLVSRNAAWQDDSTAEGTTEGTTAKGLINIFTDIIYFTWDYENIF